MDVNPNCGANVSAIMNTIACEIMDAHTLELLEFEKVRSILADYAGCTLGKELARQIEPLSNPDQIRTEQTLVSEVVTALDLGHSPPLGGLHDVRLIVKRAHIGTMLTAEELLQVAETLNCTGAIYRYRMRLDGKLGRLIEMLAPVEDLGVVAKTITGCIDTRGNVIDSASRELAKIRQTLSDYEDRIQNEIKRLLRDPNLRAILRYPNATMDGEHYVLPVAVNHRVKLPGVVHRTSATGETLFIEPASVSNLAAERSIVKGDEDREVRRILRRLSGEVGKVAKQLGYSLDVMAKLDFVYAKARYSRDYRMSEPDINTEGRLWLRDARHPILEHLFRHDPIAEQRQVMPIEIRLGIGFNMLVITGPNTGGKTVTLKSTGLISLMALSGMHIPALSGSTVPMFRQILADIGDEQSLEQSLSTFSSHISRIRTILELADEHSLVMLDELGAGTDPMEGAALGRAILDHLDQKRCRAIVTTHLGDLKTYAFTNERAENGAVEFNTETLRPTYRLHIGQFGMSNALRIAKRLKLPKDLLMRAHKYLRRRKGKGTGELVRLQELRQEAEKVRTDSLAAQHEAMQQKEEYEQKKLELERAAAAEAELKRKRQNIQPGDKVHVERFGAEGRVIRVDQKKGTVLVSVGIGQWEVGLNEVLP